MIKSIWYNFPYQSSTPIIMLSHHQETSVTRNNKHLRSARGQLRGSAKLSRLTHMSGAGWLLADLDWLWLRQLVRFISGDSV